MTFETYKMTLHFASFQSLLLLAIKMPGEIKMIEKMRVHTYFETITILHVCSS